jgi:hypothetical protein
LVQSNCKIVHCASANGNKMNVHLIKNLKSKNTKAFCNRKYV